MSASAKSSLFKLLRSDVLYEDDWLIAVNKPQGVYCESVLASVPCLLAGDSAESDSGQPVEGLFHKFSVILFHANRKILFLDLIY